METWRQSSHLASTTGQPDISIYVTRQLQRLHYPPPTRSGGVAGAEKDITGESPSVWSRDHLTYHMPPSEKSWNCAHWVRSKNSGKFRLYSVEYQYRYVLMSQWSSNSSYIDCSLSRISQPETMTYDGPHFLWAKHLLRINIIKQWNLIFKLTLCWRVTVSG